MRPLCLCRCLALVIPYLEESPDPVWPVTPREVLRELGPGREGLGRLVLPRVRWRATCEGAGLHPPSLLLLESFVFHKHKTWKWLRKMEPPNDHCLGWEWVSRWHIGEVVGDSQLQRACWGLTGNGSSWVGGREGGIGSSSMLSTGLSTGDPAGH